MCPCFPCNADSFLQNSSDQSLVPSLPSNLLLSKERISTQTSAGTVFNPLKSRYSRIVTFGALVPWFSAHVRTGLTQEILKSPQTQTHLG